MHVDWKNLSIYLGKSTATIVTLANWSWFKHYKDLFIYLSYYIYIYLSIYLTIYLSIYLGKSTAAIVTLANWNWFKDWKDKGVKKRGDDYTEIKVTILAVHKFKLE